MPNDLSYEIAHRARKGPKITMGKGMQRVAPPDPMIGVTDPAKLLKSDTQRIDRNVGTPESIWQRAPHGGGSAELAAQEVKKI